MALKGQVLSTPPTPPVEPRCLMAQLSGAWRGCYRNVAIKLGQLEFFVEPEFQSPQTTERTFPGAAFYKVVT